MRPALWVSESLSRDIVAPNGGLVLYYPFTMTLSYRIFGSPNDGAMH